MIPLSIILVSSMKSSHLNQEWNMHRSRSVYKQKDSETVLNKCWCSKTKMFVDLDSGRITGDWHFPRRKCYYGLNFDQKWLFNDGFVFQNHAAFHFTRHYFVDLSLESISRLDSFWWHPFTAEDPLVRKWSKAKFLRSNEETNSSTSWVAWGSANLTFNI